MPVKPLSRKLAEQSLDAIKERFKVWVEEEGEQYGPKLVEAWDGTHWAICWGGGPYEWSILAVHGGNDLEFGNTIEAAANFPTDKVFAEPYCGSVLMLYPQS